MSLFEQPQTTAQRALVAAQANARQQAQCKGEAATSIGSEENLIGLGEILSRVMRDLMTMPVAGITLICVAKVGDRPTGFISPTTGAAVVLAEWATTGEVTDRHLLYAPHFPESPGAQASRDKATARIAEWITDVRQIEGLQIAVLWHVDGEKQVRFNRTEGYTAEQAGEDILDILQEEVELLTFAKDVVWE